MPAAPTNQSYLDPARQPAAQQHRAGDDADHREPAAADPDAYHAADAAAADVPSPSTSPPIPQQGTPNPMLTPQGAPPQGQPIPQQAPMQLPIPPPQPMQPQGGMGMPQQGMPPQGMPLQGQGY